MGTGPASAAAGATTPVDFGANSDLVPSGFDVGDSFRLLFLSSTSRDASSTDIADYNTFAQERAAAGHADIQAHSALFRVVGCTEDTDARDNTVTTGAGVPIYWLNGPLVADDHAGFYDGEWDNETNADDRDESGANGVNTASASGYPFTGCAHDGTEFLNATDDSLALGASGNVAVGRPGSSVSGHGPIGSTAATASSNERPFYGLSPVFTVIATAPGAITDLSASASGPTQIDLNWTAPDANGAAISGYRIEVSTNTGASWSVLKADTDSTDTSYSHTGLSPAARHYYRVSAINSVGTGPASNIDDATTPNPMLGVSFGASAYTATEGGTAASVTVTLSGLPLREIEIEVTATNQGETVDADYSGVPVTLTFGASETSKTFSVTATDDSVEDAGESVQLGFGTLPAGVIEGTQASATVNLVDNDGSAARVNFGASSYNATEGGAAASVVVELSQAAGSEVEIEVTATNQGTTSDDDYSGVPVTLTFGATETSKTVSVTAANDSEDDDGESVQLGFGTPLPTGVSLGSLTTATVNLVDNDIAVPGRSDRSGCQRQRGDTDRPGLVRPGVRWRRGHQRLPHRSLQRRRGQLDRARGRHRHHRHYLLPHRPHRRRLPPLPGLGHQLRRHRQCLQRGRYHDPRSKSPSAGR